MAPSSSSPSSPFVAAQDFLRSDLQYRARKISAGPNDEVSEMSEAVLPTAARGQSHLGQPHQGCLVQQGAE
jgi:hypothetical protein